MYMDDSFGVPPFAENLSVMSQKFTQQQQQGKATMGASPENNKKNKPQGFRPRRRGHAAGRAHMCASQQLGQVAPRRAWPEYVQIGEAR